MEALLMMVRQKVEGRYALEVQYSRAVTASGNKAAQRLVERFFETREHFRWRGLGDINASALRLRDAFARRDAERHFALSETPIDDHKACQCADILRGLAKPNQCKVFGRGCTPTQPMGSCMVSSEGACNAYYRYMGIQ
jgi:hydrogenase expression/formation protein HypD